MPRQFALFLVAVQFLTRLPVPHLEQFEPAWLGRAARYLPLVGALIGWFAVGVWWLSTRVFPPAVAVGVTLGATLLLTGALHEDGFADVCDGCGGGTTRDAVLAIMKDSRIGAYGALGLCVMLGLKWATLTALPRAAFPVAVVGAHLLSRWSATALIWRLAYVRSAAQAKSTPLAGSLDAADWLMSGALGAAALLPLALLERTALSPVRGALAALAVPAVAAACTLCAGAYFHRRLGGYTGDCLGATQQLTELGCLLTALGLANAH